MLLLPPLLPSPPPPPAGYDIEDAIVMNRASLDRGFGRCIVLKKSQAVLRKYPNRTQDRVVAPAPGGGWGLGEMRQGSGFRVVGCVE